MNTEKFILGIADYIIIAGTLAISAGIGLFFQLVTKKKSNEEYLLAGKDMAMFPVIVSLMATFISATVLMGLPAEMYLFGTSMFFMCLGVIIGVVIPAYVFLPIYFANDVSTVYEYLGKRFGIYIQRIISAAFGIKIGFFTSASLYAPALALSAVTNLSMWLSTISIGVVCTFYCTLGGMKAVLWADAFQAVLMYVCLIVIIVKGSIDLGGIGNILNIANEGGRLIIPRFSMDMVTTYTMFNIVLQGAVISSASFGASQIQVQRLRTLKNLKLSRRAAFWSIPLTLIFQLLCCFCGLLFYAYFRNCDPLSAPNKPIHSADQLMPYFITVAMHDYPGLPGLCIVGIFSASLSSISSALNSLASITVEDFIRPIWPNSAQNVLTTKLISLFYGVLCIGVSFALASMGTLVRMTIILIGMIAGPNLGVFVLGACTKGANEKGAIIGVLSGITVAACLSFLPNSSKPPLLPLSNECTEFGITANASSHSLSRYTIVPTSEITNTTINTPINEGFKIPVSYMWISTIAFLTTIFVGYISSILISCFQVETKEVPDIHLSPLRTYFSKRNTDKTANSKFEEKIGSSMPEEIFSVSKQYETHM